MGIVEYFFFILFFLALLGDEASPSCCSQKNPLLCNFLFVSLLTYDNAMFGIKEYLFATG